MSLRTTIYMDEQLHAQLRDHASFTGTSMSQLVTRYCLAGLIADAMTGHMTGPGLRQAGPGSSPAGEPRQG